MQENELKLSGFVNNQQKYIGNTEEGCLEKIYKLLDALDIKFDPNPNKIRQEDIYFDAAQRQIEKLGGSLRIRNIGSQQYLTVKKPLYNRSKTLRREEIESQISETESSKNCLLQRSTLISPNAAMNIWKKFSEFTIRAMRLRLIHLFMHINSALTDMSFTAVLLQKVEILNMKLKLNKLMEMILRRILALANCPSF